MFRIKYCIRELGEHGLLVKPEPKLNQYGEMIYSGEESFDTKEALFKAAEEFNLTYFTVVEFYIKK